MLCRNDADDDDEDDVPNTLSVYVQPAGDGLNGMVARAYDDIVQALQQLLWEAAAQRASIRGGK